MSNRPATNNNQATSDSPWSRFMSRLIPEDRLFNTEGLRDFAVDADFYMLQQRPLRGTLMTHIIFLSILMFLLWSHFTQLDILVKGDAKVVPSSRLQVLQSLDGGIVKQIMVREGDTVKAGQPLLQVDSTRFVSSVRENQAQNVALAARAERLNALLENRSFVMPKHPNQEQQLVYSQEQRYFETAKFEIQTQVSIARQQLSQRQQELGEIKAKRDQAKQLLESSRYELGITKPLLKSGAVSEVDLLRLERDVAKNEGEIAQATAQISRIEAAIVEATRKIEQVELEARNNLRKDLSETMAKLNALKAGSVGLEDKVTQSIIRSPMNGLVKRLLINTVGGVITPGKDIVEVVPSDEALLLEARVTPRDIAFIRVGQRANIKFTAYDFSIYGGMEAGVDSVGADSITDEKGNTYFIVKLHTLTQKFHDDLPVIPGMQAEVDILTGKKSVLGYLMKPILRAKQVALTER